jgi:hypothetical protein
MVKLLGADSYDVQVNPGQFIIVTEMVRADGSKGPDENQRGTSYRRRRSEGGSSHSSPRSGVSGHNEGGNGRRRGSSAGRPHSREGSSYGRVDSRSRSRSDSSHSDEDEHSRELCRVRSRSSSSSPDQDDGEFVERVLHFQCGNMFDVQNIKTADIVMMETDIPADCHGRLLDLLSQTRPGTRMLTYLDLRRLWANAHLNFRQLEVNRHQADRYPTSWSVQRGHHFYLWTRVSGGFVFRFLSVVGYGTVLLIFNGAHSFYVRNTPLSPVQLMYYLRSIDQRCTVTSLCDHCTGGRKRSQRGFQQPQPRPGSRAEQLGVESARNWQQEQLAQWGGDM